MFKDFILVLIITATINSGMGIIIPILPNLLIDYGFSTVGLSIPFVALVLARILIKPYTGQLLTRMAARTLLIISSILYVLIFVLYANIESKYGFIGLRFFEGIVEGIVGVVVTDMAIAYTSGKRNSGFLMGLFSSSFGLGFLLGPLVGSLVYNNYGIKEMFYAGAAIGGISLISSLLLVKGEKKSSVGGNNGILKTSWRARKYLGIYMPSILRRSLLFSFMMIIPLFCIDRLNIPKEDVGYLFVVSALITTTLMPFTGKLSDIISARLITIFGLLCMGLSLLAISLSDTLVAFLVFYILETLAFAFMLPAATKIFAVKIADDPDRPVIVGAFTGLVEVVTLFLALLLPVLYSFNVSAPWVLLAVVCILSIVPFMGKEKHASEKLDYAA